MAKYTVGGFTFTDEESAKKAARELKAVDYILGQLQNSDDANVLKLYNKLLDQKMFQTPVGKSFLKQLRNNLLNSKEFSPDQIRPLYFSDGEIEADKVEPKKTSKKSNGDVVEGEKSKEILRLKRINFILTIVSITLGLCVAGMFYVSSTINSPTILNYEEEILNKYSAWEQDLTEREEALREKEHLSE